MASRAPAAAPNRYCQRLGIAVPDLDAAVKEPNAKLGDLMTLALLEAGGPMSLEEITVRLGRLALPPRLAAARNPAALLRAWHGQPPPIRDREDGRFYLDLLAHHEIRWAVFLGERASIDGELQSARPEPPAQRPDTEPLTAEEVAAAFRARDLLACSSIRKAAAILEVAGGGPLSVEEVSRRLEAVGSRYGITDRDASLWRSDLIEIEPDGLLRLNPQSAKLPGMRRAIRQMAAAGLRRHAESEAFQHRRHAFDERRLARERRTEEQARSARRALLHVVAVDDVARAASVIDVSARTQRLFIDDLDALPTHLEQFDFFAGADIRPSLRRLGLDPDRWWLADLRPTQKTFRPSELGPLPVTLPSIVLATTGRKNVPADEKTWRLLLAGGRGTARLTSRLEEEAEALFDLYEFGALHGGVRVRQRAGDRLLPVRWSMEADPGFFDFVAASIREWLPLECVLGPAPGLADPWAGVVTKTTVVEQQLDELFVREGEGVRALDPAEVRAVRLPAGASGARIVRRERIWHLDERMCVLNVTLDGIEPPIWRRLQVSASTRLSKLHDYLQAVLGWTNSHLHVFRIGDEHIGIPYDIDQLLEGDFTRSARLVTLGDVLDHGFRRFTYEYDFGDSWEHTIEVEQVLERSEGDSAARCLDGARACPPEDCGGVGGYEQLLEILFDPTHPEFEDTRQWAQGFEPDRFNVHWANAALGRVEFGDR